MEVRRDMAEAFRASRGARFWNCRHALVALLLLVSAGRAYGGGEQYIEAYNALYRMITNRCALVGLSSANLQPKAADAESVTQTDLELFRAKVVLLMSQYFLAPPANWNMGTAVITNAFPYMIRAEAHPDAPFICVPAELSANNETVYGQTIGENCPLLWIHFQDLYNHLLAMRYTLRLEGGTASAAGHWISKGEQSKRQGLSGGGLYNWAYAKAVAESKFFASAAAANTDEAPAYYTVGLCAKNWPWDNYAAEVLSRYAYFQLTGIPPYSHKASFYAYTRTPLQQSVLRATNLWDNSLGIGGLQENRWTKYCEQGLGNQTTRTSDRLGRVDMTSVTWCPDVPDPTTYGRTQLETAKGFAVSAAVVALEWTELLRETLRQPADNDVESDGLVETGCECTQCEPEADPGWASLKADAAIRFPLGLSSGQKTGGVRIKACISERLLLGVPRQTFSLDTRLTTQADSLNRWKTATIRRPNGTEVTFALTGAKTGLPAEGTKSYRIAESNGWYLVHFAGKRQVTHCYTNGELRQVRARLQNHEVSVDGTPDAWPGLAVTRVWGSKAITRVVDPLGIAVPVYTGSLVSDIDYKTHAWLAKHGSKVRAGSRIVVECDALGRTNRSTRIKVEAGKTTVETSDGAGVLLKRAVREEELDAAGSQLTVRETVEAAATSNIATRVFQSFPWGWELVREVDGPEGVGAPVTVWSYNTNALDTGSYGRVQSVLSPNGSWARYEYEAQGRVAAEVTVFGNGAPDAAAAASAVVFNWYAGDARLGEAGFPGDVVCANDQRPRVVIRMVQGIEVSRTYHAYLADQCVSKRCIRAGAGYDDPGNLVAVTGVYTNGPYEGRTRWVQHEDGTFDVFSYALDEVSGLLTATQRSGEGGEAGVTNGSETVTVTDSAGNAVSTVVRDIASGIVTAWTEYTRDSMGRVTQTLSPLDGSFSTTAYGCCGPESETDAEGITTLRSYNALKQVENVQRLGVTERYTYDSRGNQVRVERAAGGETAVVTMGYDGAGRLVAVTNELGAVTSHAYETNAAGGARVITTNPDGGAQVEDAYCDGRPWSATGTAVSAACLAYGADGEGFFSVEYRGADTNAQEWVKTWQNMLGLSARVLYPDGYEQRTQYDAAGRVTAEADGFVTTLTGYNGLGEAWRSAVDMDGNGVADPAGSDRISETETRYAVWSGHPVRETLAWVYPETGSAARKLVSVSRAAVDGTEAWSESFGRTHHQTVTRNRNAASRSETSTAPDGTVTVSAYTNGLLMAVTHLDCNGAVISARRLEYDAWGRPSVVRETAANGEERVTRTGYDLAGRTTCVTVSAGGRDEVTRFEYDAMGRRVATVQPDGGRVEAEYDLRGNLVAQGGARTYPVGYGYDGQGRLASMSTYRNGTNGVADVTQWEYDAQRGWLSAKRYADGSYLSYQSYRNGALRSRTWARGVETRYAYDAGGALTNRWYSDGTPPVSMDLDREGRPTVVRDASGVHAVQYAEDGQIAEEEQGILPGGKVIYQRDGLGRRLALRGSAPDGSALAETRYGYDSAGRLARVILPGGGEAGYAYGADGMTVTNIAHGSGLYTERSFDGHGRLIAARSVVNGTVLVGVDSAYNAAGLRVTNALSDGSRWSYDYDALGQLTAAKRYWSDGVPVGGCQFEYAYDTIGNRTRSCMPAGRKTQWREYAANQLNQYEQVTAPGQVWVTGVAAGNALVSVQANEDRAQLANRHGEYFWTMSEVNNRDGTIEVSNTVRAVISGVAGGATNSLVRTEARTELLPRTPEQFSYDADGNLLRDGLWSYSWDAENRLIRVEALPSVPAAHRTRLDFTYDHIGRRVAKSSAAGTNYFLYDGWNIIQEVRSQETGGSTNSYVWGLDLSGTLQGAGGVGGLLGIFSSGSSSPRTPIFDALGNVVAVVDANSPATTLARYEYGPFGEVLRASGVDADINPWLFSTRYADPETRLVMYPMRPYSPALGRFLSRDPLEEEGGQDLYRFVDNSAVDFIDPFGLALYAFDGTGTRYETWTHVGILHRSYQGTKWYKEGVGSKWYSMIFGGVSGLGGDIRLMDMYQLLVETYKKGDHAIDIIGFSRGASLAREFANMIHETGIDETAYVMDHYKWRNGDSGAKKNQDVIDCDPDIRFVGLFDTVGSFGIPGNDINIGIRMGLPPNVKNAAQAVAQDERRSEFPLTPLSIALPGQVFSEQVFPGDHSDIGGGYEEKQNMLALAPLFYIWKKGRDALVPFGPIGLVHAGSQAFLEVGSERRPWAYQQDMTPHDLAASIPYSDGGRRRNLPKGTL